jgi:hypothetical protein
MKASERRISEVKCEDLKSWSIGKPSQKLREGSVYDIFEVIEGIPS